MTSGKRKLTIFAATMPHLPPPTVILLASVLKPLDDTRMFGKFGRTLAARSGTAVHVAGREAALPPDTPDNLYTHSLLRGTRLSWARLQAQVHYWRLLRQLQPQLVVVHAPELLPLTLLWQALGFRRQFLYDVRENYALNIRTQHVYPAWLRGLLAGAVRTLETVAARRAARILLAERSYAAELPFASPQNTVVLENKYQPQPTETLPTQARSLPAFGQPLRLLYSGTISELNGVFEAVEFTQRLRRHWPNAQLTIAGFCQQPAVLAQLQQLAAADDAIVLVGGDEPVPHAHIVAEIQRSHLGLLPYRPHPSSAHCIPTKLYEYLAHGLPLLLPPNPLWQEVACRYQAAVVVEFPHVSEAVLTKLTAQHFYPTGPSAAALWATEAIKLGAVVDSIQQLPTFAGR
ncbi:glycosyltransferase family protein [Hymenobacter puniceus]|uniref:glycosyltransferase n=1 Tax=Hymenobacter sp. BT190 TaxID=2763505 RepID=UPI0016517DF6|nr:glycosyltransferase [Hymenobacter sp. BT190]MBC6698793.1 glycosyltransferase [Hymenobacter sp. BT190]